MRTMIYVIDRYDWYYVQALKKRDWRRNCAQKNEAGCWYFFQAPISALQLKC